MKTIAFLIVLIGFMSLKAQIPNNGFELWTIVNGYTSPNGWGNSSLLDNFDFDINYFDYRTPINGTNKFLIHIGEFTLEWIGEDGTNLIFKITRK